MPSDSLESSLPRKRGSKDLFWTNFSDEQSEDNLQTQEFDYEIKIQSKGAGESLIQEKKIFGQSTKTKPISEIFEPLKCPLMVKKNDQAFCYGQATVTLELTLEDYKIYETKYYQVIFSKKNWKFPFYN